MTTRTRRKCRHCGQLFRPDPRNPTSSSPGTSVGARVVSGGMLAARYWAISDRSFGMSAKSTMLEKCSAHSSSV